MPNINLSKVVQTVPLEDLRLVAVVKQRLEGRREKRAAIYKELAAVEKRIESLQASLPRAVLDESGLTRMRQAIKRRLRETGLRQPSMESLVMELLRERRGSLSIQEIAEALLTEKGYRTRSPNVKNQLRVLLYRNRKGLFQKVGPGRFAPAQEAAGVGQHPSVGRGRSNTAGGGTR